MDESEIIAIRAKTIRRTDRGIMVEGGIWLPLSLVEVGETGADGRALIDLPEWLVLDRGLDALVEI